MNLIVNFTPTGMIPTKEMTPHVPVTVNEIVEDVLLTVKYYDQMRLYQQLLDPSAYFLTAWLPDNTQMRAKGIVADYLRRPSEPQNLALEIMLAAASREIGAGDYGRAEEILKGVEIVLEAYPQRGLDAFDLSPAAATYLALVRATRSAGFEPQRISLQNETARIWVSTSGPALSEITAVKNGGQWGIMPMAGN